MPQSEHASSTPGHIERPMCPVCKSLMYLSRIDPGKQPGIDHRTFECLACRHIETTTVKYR
jgi:hypothetical protein